jgi:hypothetical protein
MHKQAIHDQVILFFILFSFFLKISANQLKESGACEGYNLRLNKIMPRNPLALNKMVDFLASEDEYWCRVVNDSRLWGDK